MHQKCEGEHVDEIFKSRKSEIVLLFTKQTQTNCVKNRLHVIAWTEGFTSSYYKPWCEIHKDRRLWGKSYVKALVSQH